MNISLIAAKSYNTGAGCYQNVSIFDTSSIKAGGNIAAHSGTSGTTHHDEANLGIGGATQYAEAQSGTTGTTHHGEANLGTGGATQYAEAQSGTTFGRCYPKFSQPLPELISGSFVVPACCRTFQS